MNQRRRRTDLRSTTNVQDSQRARADERAVGGTTQDDVAQRAYERFEARGGEHGHDWEDWFEAEEELNRR